ncbi:MAG: protein translocase subunit SecD [Alphaproteobacteria bacterium]|jgi:preprotein translocase subunit SecD|nr:protein translocase subunit SecD [Alphaproteobacteria bacterium]MCV6599815.1 protein translocase subunit SecD [Alphaproteobacteria bacterium]
MVNISKFKLYLIAFVCLISVFFALPNVLPEKALESKLISNKTVNLGLDLRGGSHLLFEVETENVVKERLDSLLDTIRVELRKAKIKRIGPKTKKETIEVKIVNFKDLEPARKLLRKVEDGIEVSVNEDNVITLNYSEQAVEQIKEDAVAKSIETIRRRIDETGTREPTIQKQGENRILIQLPGVDDPARVKNLIGKTAKLTFHMLHPGNDVVGAKKKLPIGTKILPDNNPEVAREYVVKKRVRLSGDNLLNAAATFQQGRPVVSFKFNRKGAKKFANITKENVGKPFAIVLDNKVISAPNINEPILGGSGVISGSFTVQEATDLAMLLRAGALPAPMKVLEERTVGPSLGADSVKAGKIASMVGLIAVMFFMILIYKRFGIYASIALSLNIVLIFAALSILQATLTLPGIAGIVLTIGMAVDANVLIFERIKEEFKNGRTVLASVDSGYRRALSTIVDSNLTTLIAAMFLFAVGTGPIKGFAVTLSIGIITSMFSAIMITRVMIINWLRTKKPSQLSI